MSIFGKMIKLTSTVENRHVTSEWMCAFIVQNRRARRLFLMIKQVLNGQLGNECLNSCDGSADH
jgi:hypothetical protein